MPALGADRRLSLWVRLTSPDVRFLRWRILVLVAVTFVPLLLLTINRGSWFGAGGAASLLRDYVVTVRFLFVIPVLIVAEALTRVRLLQLRSDFEVSGLVAAHDVPVFDRIAQRSFDLRDSRLAQIAAALILVVDMVVGGTVPFADASWYFVDGANGVVLSPAGRWFLLVSRPVFQFILLGWLWRYALWCWFLYRTSKLDLVLVPTHPDRSAGLTPLSYVHMYYGGIVFAFSAILSAYIGVQIVEGGQKLVDYRVTLVAFVLTSVVVVLAPLLMFTPKLIRVRRRGLIDYGRLATRYTTEFDRKWLHNEAPADEPFIGSADIQSLADLANSFSVVQGMRVVPFELRTITSVMLIAMVPLLPLVFAIFSPVEVLKGLMQILL